MEQTKLLSVLVVVLSLSGCASSTIQLNDHNRSYTQYQHIVDKRFERSVASNRHYLIEGDRVIKHLDTLSNILVAGPYAAGTVEINKDKLLIPHSQFSIPPVLALDMAIDAHIKDENKILSTFELKAFDIRSQYLFLGIPSASNDAECLISANYRGIKIGTRKRTTFGLSDYDEKMTQMIEQCINSIIDNISAIDERDRD